MPLMAVVKDSSAFRLVVRKSSLLSRIAVDRRVLPYPMIWTARALSSTGSFFALSTLPMESALVWEHPAALCDHPVKGNVNSA